MNDYNQIAAKYNRQENCHFNEDRSRFYSGTGYLVERDLPGFIAQYNPVKEILDFGCGTGLSTRLLKMSGFNALGADISETALKIAQGEDPAGKYIKIKRHEALPFVDAHFFYGRVCFCFNRITHYRSVNAVFC